MLDYRVRVVYAVCIRKSIPDGRWREGEGAQGDNVMAVKPNILVGVGIGFTVNYAIHATSATDVLNCYECHTKCKLYGNFTQLLTQYSEHTFQKFSSFIIFRFGFRCG